MKRAYIFAITLLLSAVVTYGVSVWMHDEGQTPKPCSLDSLAGYLSLSSQQIKQMTPIYAELGEKRAEALKERDAATRHLVSVLKSDDLTPDQIDQALKSVDVAQSKLRVLTIHHLVQLKTVLTKEQQDRLFELVGERLCIAGPNSASK